MEVRQLNTLIRAAQFQSFSKAAESLGYSQSAVTVQIKALEEELGVRLNLEENGTRKPGARTISTPDSKIKVLIIPTNEELQIAQATMEVLA